MKKVLFIFIILCIFTAIQSFSQGCSDAGFCSMGAMKPDQHFSRKLTLKLRSIRLERYWAITKFSNTIQSTTLEFNASLGKKNVIQAKVPYMSSEAQNWRLEGVGDISLSFTRNIVDKEKYKINATLGAKIPTGDANGGLAGGVTLPMYYQISLGTYDAIAGISLINKKWLVALGYQQPLNANNNQFTWGQWADHPKQKYILKYSPSKNLRRSTDFMCRIQRNFSFSRWVFTSGFLFIQRFNKDRITSPQTGETVRVDGSEGMAWSLLLSAQYRFSHKSSLQLVFGNEVIQRVKNPDGLSREQVLTLAYQYNF